jgi:hypothetical protein
LRFVALGFKFFAIATITSIPLMLIHIYAQNIAKMDFVGLDHKLVNPSLALLSVTHVPKGSLVFYFHAFFAYGYTLLAFYLLHQVWSEYITLRQDYFASTAYTSQDHNKTLLFTYIPEEMKSNEMIKESIAHLEFQPTRIFFGRDYMSLPKWIEQHRQATAEFEKLIHNCIFF